MVCAAGVSLAQFDSWTYVEVDNSRAGHWYGIAVCDVTGDGKPDIIVTEEASLSGLYCFVQPADPKSGNWTRHTIARGADYLSMDVGDLDNDEDLDIVTGEALGALKIEIWVNDGSGSFTSRMAAQGGKQPHIGCQLYDLDCDGDLDMVGNSWKMSAFCFVWRNDWNPPVTASSPLRPTGRAQNIQPLVRGSAWRMELSPVQSSTITLLDLRGMVIQRQQVESGGTSVCDLRDRAPGSYLVRQAGVKRVERVISTH